MVVVLKRHLVMVILRMEIIEHLSSERSSHMKFRHIQVYMMNLISKIVHFLMSIHYVVTLRNV